MQKNQEVFYVLGVNKDGWVNIRDLYAVARDCGKTA